MLVGCLYMNNNLEVQACSWSWRIFVHKMKPKEKTDETERRVVTGLFAI